MAEISGSSNKDLLQLERSSATATASCLESKMFVCKKGDAAFPSGALVQKPTMFPVPRSEVLGKVKDFLGVFSESNKKLLHDAKDNPENYDIEVLNGKESEVIEMDLMLGIADLHTPEAVAAAESAMAGYQPPTNLLDNGSSSDTEDSSDEDNDDNENDEIDERVSKSKPKSAKLESRDTEKDPSGEKPQKRKPKKRSKIVELS